MGIDQEGGTDKTYDEFIEALPENEPRYALVDVEYDNDEGVKQNKLCFFFWSPDDGCSIKDKMIYASSKDAIKKKMVGVMKEVQANERSELDFGEVVAIMKKK